MMKNACKFLLVAIGIFAISCQKNTNSTVLVNGTVIEMDSYGGLHPSFTCEEIEAAGVEYGDLLEIQIGNIVVATPYVDAYTEAGSMSPCLCNYNRGGGNNFSLSCANGSFASHIGGNVGDTLIVRMKEKGGYQREFNLLQGTYTYDRNDYASDEVFANFREINTTNLRPKVLFRSTSPISFEKNKVRYSYAAALCKKHGVQTIIDIADSEEKIHRYVLSSENEGSYMREQLDKGLIIGLGSNADYLDRIFMEKLASGIRQMIAKPAPYLIHCNEGKDRTGFYCILLEALCGATIDEMREDYMKTFENLYHQTHGSEQYELTWKKNGYRMLYSIANPQTWDHVAETDWDAITIENTDLSQAAAQYLQMAGLTEEEINQLKTILME